MCRWNRLNRELSALSIILRPLAVVRVTRIGIVQGGVLAQLESTYVGDDGPPLLRRHSRRVRIQHPVGVRNVMQVSVGGSPARTIA